ncbi:hypothetical protein TNCV_3041531 [Trichonephila clavipes]|nr:hypothetical protein TNCV_3041531 [Trichonephila clavipes]
MFTERLHKIRVLEEEASSPIITWSSGNPICFIFHCNELFLSTARCHLALPFSSYINVSEATQSASTIANSMMLMQAKLILRKNEEGNSIDQDEPDIEGQITPSSETMKPPEQPKKG